MIEVVTIKAEKGGTLERQNKKLEEAKKQLSALLKQAERIISNNVVENDNEIQFIAVVELPEKGKPSISTKEKK